MKEYINKKQTLICIGIVVFIALVSLGVLMFKPEAKTPPDSAASTTFLSSGDNVMYLDEGIFMTQNKQAYYEALYLADGYLMNWDTEVQSGETFEAQVLNESLEFAQYVFVFSEYAKAQGITLTDEELSKITTDVNDFLTMSEDNVLKATLATEELVTRVYTRTAYYDKVCNQIYEGLDLTVSDEEARQCRVAAVELSPLYFDSPERTAAKIVERVNNGEIITKVASIYDSEAVEGNVGRGDMDGNAFEQLCLSLKDGQCRMTEMDGTYFVIYCYLENDTEATEIAKENIITARKDAAVRDFYENLVKDEPIKVNTEAWSTIDFDEAIFTEEDMGSITSTGN